MPGRLSDSRYHRMRHLPGVAVFDHTQIERVIKHGDPVRTAQHIWEAAHSMMSLSEKVPRAACAAASKTPDTSQGR